MRTENGQKFCTAHAGKTVLEIGDKALHLAALVAPRFGEGLIAVSQLTAKGNKVLFTKKRTFITLILKRLSRQTHHQKRGNDNLFNYKLA